MPQNFDDWIGREEIRSDLASAAPLLRLAALLDYETPPWNDAELPPLSHWLFHLGCERQSQLGRDGHPQRVGFLPPIALSRRMWGGSRVRILHPIAVGTEMRRRSHILEISTKSGGGGEMTIVTVRHQITGEHVVAIEEDQDIIYLGAERAARPGATRNLRAPEPGITRRISATPELLFRFSALTFNTHRIHYDRDYARREEGYPGLVVHGPLLATLLVDHFRRQCPGKRLASFSFRARAPVFDFEPFDLCMRVREGGATLWVAGEDGALRMTAELQTQSGAQSPGNTTSGSD